MCIYNRENLRFHTLIDIIMEKCYNDTRGVRKCARAIDMLERKWSKLLYRYDYKIKKTSEEVLVAHTVLSEIRRFERIFI